MGCVFELLFSYLVFALNTVAIYVYFVLEMKYIVVLIDKN